MKLINFIKKYQLIIFLVVIIVFLAFVKLKFSSNDPIPAQKNSSIFQNYSLNNNLTPTLTPKQNEEQIIEESDGYIDLDYDFPLGRILPYNGKSFKVERYKDINLLEVIVKNGYDFETVKREVDDWLIENGVEKDDKYEIRSNNY